MALKRKRSNSATRLLEPNEDTWSTSSTSSNRQFELATTEFTVKIDVPKQPRNRKKPKAKFELDIINKLIIQPSKWHRMRDYSSFIHSEITFKRGDIVEVKRPGNDGVHGERREWIAKVLDVRADDPSHVYVRIAWFYWPEDLPMGRMEYHGRNEVIESNHPDIIDAMTVNGKADIKEWDEEDEDASFEGYYYRQQFDYLSGQLTAPRQFCICKEYYNPDTKIVNCSECQIWMHEECIIKDAIRRHKKSSLVVKTSEDSKSDPNPTPVEKGANKSRHKPKKSTSKPDQGIAAVLFEGKIRIREVTKKGDNDSDSGLDSDTIIDEDIHCLQCGEVVS
ncbi:hypothetical protein TWF106_003395 [Orbilia oligospora]|uniref:BAH domain-containing protein n=1 Tax=Orbilia oligospora TaxID=2813651 RepID=A0A6G1MD28_ORBOL|nr:hypothetical protein TWF788_010900 [Orbilia oligospora]KAF3196526.1 hypothetical protein TWF679_004942 [Orbilia oligospora]KAF3200342.1 hypothetical protein TWF106_003395 [Orbilia oligospora]KAF3230700.1 hypothetical protein TWF191_009608 [Orbilia oligospora]KAF3254083.1 hypothetical protein TWF192_003594 [Orbilia oligospora]